MPEGSDLSPLFEEREREGERGRGSDWRRRSCRVGTQRDREGERRKKKEEKKEQVGKGGLS
jgi:hypothetical protein